MAYVVQMLDAGYYPNPVITGNNAALTDGIVIPTNNFIEITQTVVVASKDKLIEVPLLVLTPGVPAPLVATFGSNKTFRHPLVASYEWGTPGNTQPTTGSIAQYRVTRDQEEHLVPFVPPTLVT